MWVDRFKGAHCVGERGIESPATPDGLWFRFEDGSELRIEVDAGLDWSEYEGELEAADAAETRRAVVVFQGLVALVYGLAGEYQSDVDYYEPDAPESEEVAESKGPLGVEQERVSRILERLTEFEEEQTRRLDELKDALIGDGCVEVPF